MRSAPSSSSAADCAAGTRVARQLTAKRHRRARSRARRRPPQRRSSKAPEPARRVALGHPRRPRPGLVRAKPIRRAIRRTRSRCRFAGRRVPARRRPRRRREPLERLRLAVVGVRADAAQPLRVALRQAGDSGRYADPGLGRDLRRDGALSPPVREALRHLRQGGKYQGRDSSPAAIRSRRRGATIIRSSRWSRPQAGLIFKAACEKLGYKPFHRAVRQFLGTSITNPDGMRLGACQYCGHCEKFICEAQAKATPETLLYPVLFERPSFEMRQRATCSASITTSRPSAPSACATSIS